jgi:hypothetical protein
MTRCRMGCPIGNLALETSNGHPKIRGLVVENFQAWGEAIEALFLQASGRLPQGLDTRALSRHVLATMEGAVMLARAYRDFEPFDQAVTHLRDYVDRLLSDGTDWRAGDGSSVPQKEGSR